MGVDGVKSALYFVRVSPTAGTNTKDKIMDAKHTPGPWHVSGEVRGTGFNVSDANKRSVAAFPSTSRRADVERTANAHLIAAAPDLLATAKEMLAAIEAVAKEQLNLRKLESHLHELDRAEEKLRAAIAKAESQS